MSAAVERNPFITRAGKMADPVAAARWDAARMNAYRDAHPPQPNLVRDMPRCAWFGQHREGASGLCVDCGQPVRPAVRFPKEQAA